MLLWTSLSHDQTALETPSLPNFPTSELRGVMSNNFCNHSHLLHTVLDVNRSLRFFILAYFFQFLTSVTFHIKSCGWTANWNIIENTKWPSAVSKSQELQLRHSLKNLNVSQHTITNEALCVRSPNLQILFSRCKGTCLFGTGKLSICRLIDWSLRFEVLFHLFEI